jgi:hypothetical protein
MDMILPHSSCGMCKSEGEMVDLDEYFGFRAKSVNPRIPQAVALPLGENARFPFDGAGFGLLLLLLLLLLHRLVPICSFVFASHIWLCNFGFGFELLLIVCWEPAAADCRGTPDSFSSILSWLFWCRGLEEFLVLLVPWGLLIFRLVANVLVFCRSSDLVENGQKNLEAGFFGLDFCFVVSESSWVAKELAAGGTLSISSLLSAW